MSCDSCDKTANGMTGLEYTWNGPSIAFTATDGTALRLDRPLVRRPNTPHGGWKVELVVNGQRSVIPGRSPAEVHKHASELLSTNGITITTSNLWLNLQVQWLTKTLKKYRLIELDALFAKASPSASAPMGSHEKPIWNSSDWGNRIWLFLDLYLRGEIYNNRVFCSLVETSLTMIDPVNNRLLGNATSFMEFNGCVSALRKSPPFLKEDARKWLIETMRTLGLKMGATRASLDAVEQINH